MKRLFSVFFALLLLLSPVSAIFAQEEAQEIQVQRIAGKGRYNTTVQISKEGFEKSEYAVIASGEKYPDALAGGQLAGYLKAPLLITSTDTVTDELLAELKRLEVKTIYLLGGEAALTKNVYDTLDTDYTVHRLSGANRLETSQAIAEEARKHTDEKDTYYASSDNFPDALSAAPLVVEKQGILLLNSSLKPVTDGIAVGGDKAVPGTPEDRLAGANRYETAVAVAKAYENQSKTVILASGVAFPDALSASGFAAVHDYPILLTDRYHLSPATATYLREADIETVIVLGGSSAVSDAVVKAVKELHSEPPVTEPPVTEPPATEPPTTEPPTTEPKPEPGPSEKAYLYANGRIIGNINSNIYHMPGQRDYEKINYENAVFFNTEAEAQAANYRKAFR